MRSQAVIKHVIHQVDEIGDVYQILRIIIDIAGQIDATDILTESHLHIVKAPTVGRDGAVRYETENQLVIQAELPGFEKDEIHVSFENGQLSLSGERQAEESKDRTYHRNERWYGRFERTFQLSSVFDPGKIKASLKDGVLTLTLPKREEAKA